MSELPEHRNPTVPPAEGKPPASPGGVTRRSALGAAAVAPLLQSCGDQANDKNLSASAFRQVGRGAITRAMLDKVREIVSVKDFGALGDGVTDDTAAIQAAFSSGAKKVTFPPGRYLTGPLRLPDWLHIQGEAYQPGIGGDGRAAELRFKLHSGAGLTCGSNPVIQNLFFQNTGGTFDEARRVLTGTTARAIDLRENALIEDCCFSLWGECIRTGFETYYLKTTRLHFNRCIYGYRAVTGVPYNIHIDAPFSALTDIFIAGEKAHNPRNIKVYGGSIEGYATVAKRFSEISFFGTYFESDAPHLDVVAIDPGIDGSSVALFGCLIFMNRTARFVSMTGLEGAMLTSVGNIYDGVGQAKGICHSLPASGSVTLAGDRFGNNHPDDCLYVDSIAAAGRFNVSFPHLPAGNAQSAYSGMQFVGSRGFMMNSLAAEPVPQVAGMTVLADGKTWDPLTRKTGRPYWVMWQGGRWTTLDGAIG